MAERNSFILYYEFGEHIDSLTDEQAGQLFRMIYAYERGFPLPEACAVVRMAFISIRQRLDKDRAKWEETCSSRREAGEKGGAPKGNRNAAKRADPNDSPPNTPNKQNKQKLVWPLAEADKQAKQADFDSDFDSEGDGEGEEPKEKGLLPGGVPSPALTSPSPALTSSSSALMSPSPALTSSSSALTSPSPALTSPSPALMSPSSAPASAAGPPVISLPLNDKTDYAVTREQVAGWEELYPAVDVGQELREMRGWLEANPAKRKTRRGILRFIVNWLAREQDKGGRPGRAVAELAEGPEERRNREELERWIRGEWSNGT